jgi:hypothetical protein
MVCKKSRLVEPMVVVPLSKGRLTSKKSQNGSKRSGFLQHQWGEVDALVSPDSITTTPRARLRWRI